MTKYDDKGQLAGIPTNPYRKACAWSTDKLRKLLDRWDKLPETNRKATVRSVAEALDEKSDPKLQGPQTNSEEVVRK